MPKHRKKGHQFERHWWETTWLTSPSEVDQEIAEDALKALPGTKRKKAKS